MTDVLESNGCESIISRQIPRKNSNVMRSNKRSNKRASSLDPSLSPSTVSRCDPEDNPTLDDFPTGKKRDRLNAIVIISSHLL